MTEMRVRLRANGVGRTGWAEPRRSLADFLREDLGLTGTHLGCEHGVCGACTVVIDGATARSCLQLAVQSDGHEITTVEGLGGPNGELHPVQQALYDSHAFQCGFCTPGFVVAIKAVLEKNPNATAAEVEHGLTGNICRCGTYEQMRHAITQLCKKGG